MKIRLSQSLAALWAVLLAVLVPLAANSAPVASFGFEQETPGQAPAGWAVTPEMAAGYALGVTEEKPREGRLCAVLASTGTAISQGFGAAFRSFDAAPYQGKRIRFRAAARAELGPMGQRARLFLGSGKAAAGIFTATSAPVTSGEWASYEAVADIPKDAKVVETGLALVGDGKAFLDAASLEVIGEAGAGNEPARALTPRGLDNLTAFARLFGYVRYFHPSDQAAAADWESLALAGVQAVEKAGSPEELARALEGFFGPVAPSVRVYPTVRPPAGLAGPARPAGGPPRVVTWNHYGVSLSKEPSIYKSLRKATGDRAPAAGAAVIRYLDSEALRGRTVRLRVRGRAEVTGSHQAKLYLQVLEGRMGTERPLGEAVVTSPEWATYEVTAEVPASARALLMRLQLTSEGRVFWDDITLEPVGGEPLAEPVLTDGGFETAGELSEDWNLSRELQWAGYAAAVSTDRPASGKASLLFSYAPPQAPEEDAAPLTADLGGGVSALVPLALYKDDQGTLPHVAPEAKPPVPAKPEGFAPSGDDRTTRLADVVLAWNVFQHFYPYFDVVKTDWPAELPKALAAAAGDADQRAFLNTLRRLVAALHDGHGNAFLSALAESHALPLLWDWVEGQLVITRVKPGEDVGLAPGEVVVSLDGRPAAEVLTAREELVSGATPQWRRWVALNALLSGAEGEEVKLAVKRPDGSPGTVTLRRSMALTGQELTEVKPEKIAEVRPGIFYVDLDRINDDDFKGALERLAQAKGLIFDLRGYPRNVSPVVIAHLTDTPVTSARWNVPIITRPDHQDMKFHFSNWTVTPLAPRLQGKAAFIIDGRAISYAETYMGIIESYKLAAIVGSPTAGTNGNVNPLQLPGGYRISWTGMKVLKHDGSQHHGVGILPTVPAARTLRGVTEGRDELLEKAIEVVSQ